MRQLQAQVRIPVEHVSPLARLDLSRIDLAPEQSASIDPVLAAPIGLALPEPNASVKKFNLVPPEVTRRAFERKVVRYSFAAAAVVAVLVVGFSGWRFWEVHEAQDHVGTLHASVAELNAQIPTFDKVVAIANELRTSKVQVTHISASAVDWSAVVGQLGAKIPAGLSITTFTGSSGAGSTTTSSSTALPAGTTVTPDAIGTLTLGLGGTFPSSAHFDPVAEWIDNITTSTMFSPPGVTSVANAPLNGNTSVTFQSTLELTPDANLTKNAGL